jgi:UDP-3-O-[3-hydroxymyristoyl] glucosamine N-acyltransferase
MSFSIEQIQQLTGALVANDSVKELLPQELLSTRIQSLQNLKQAGPQDIACFFSKAYQADLLVSRAGVIVTGKEFIQPIQAAGIPIWKKAVFLACDDPYQAMAILTALFSKSQSAHDHQVTSVEAKIHPMAVVDPTAVIEPGVVIYPHVYVGPGCRVGEGSVLFPSVTLYEGTQIGKRCRIHAGAVIGADGFGYAPVMKLIDGKKVPVDHLKIYHLGRVVLGDDVEVGANSSIDRGTLGDTVIHSKAKIDNQVQIGHNCTVGEGAVLCGAAGMAGSSSLGKFVVVGAQSGTSNQVHVGDYSKLAGYTGATKDCEPFSELAGVPARSLSDQFRILALQNKVLRESKKSKK